MGGSRFTSLRILARHLIKLSRAMSQSLHFLAMVYLLGLGRWAEDLSGIVRATPRVASASQENAFPGRAGER